LEIGDTADLETCATTLALLDGKKQNSRRDFARRLFETFYERPVKSLIGSPLLEASA
jgi:hypothetical protein